HRSFLRHSPLPPPPRPPLFPYTTLFRSHNTGFTDIDMPVDAALRLISIAVDRFIDTKFATEVSFEVPDDVLQGFPEPVRTFFHQIGEHTSELQSRFDLVCRLLLEKKKRT